ncbi:hypothetical protein BST61_g4191 [Cercospora zeina]
MLISVPLATHCRSSRSAVSSSSIESEYGCWNLGHVVNVGIHQYKRIKPCDQVENPYAKLVPDQQIAIVPSFRLEAGATLLQVPVAYMTYGTLDRSRSNAVVVCHAFTGNADVQQWWSPLLGSGGNEVLDTSRFFVVCINCLGSPYGTASPVTGIDGDAAKGCYGPSFPLTTIRDDVRLFKLLLDDLGVRQIAAVVGGSMGGMHVLEFAYFGPQYVRTIIPIATSSQCSAWCIGWSEAQRQCIFSDCKYDYGYYEFSDPPSCGLGAARMNAMLTYRSKASFDDRFGRRKLEGELAPRTTGGDETVKLYTHHDGHKNGRGHSSGQDLPKKRNPDAPSLGCEVRQVERHDTCYLAQSYLRYQSEKFVRRFDANCYIAITRKLDTHDIARDRASTAKEALRMIQQPALILGIPNDGLFTYQEQCDLSAAIPNAHFETVHSRSGHDGFLLEHDQINHALKKFIRRELSDI